jgi:thiamine-phosphate pyrophosphorylase
MLESAQLYGILDLGYIAPADLLLVTEKMLEGGVDVLQLRAKGCSEAEVETWGHEIAGLSESAGVPLLINDHAQLVPSIGAQGVHVGQDDFSVEDARWRAGRSLAGEVPGPLVGKSTHSLEQALEAERVGADYIGFGPLFSTPTKPGRPAIGLDQIRAVHSQVRIPIFCIGGIKRENLQQVLEAGARRVVIVSGILQARDIVGYCRDVRSVLRAVW